MHASVVFPAARRAITFAFAVLFVVIGISAEWAGSADVDGKKQSGSELMRNIQRIGNNAGREISKAAGAGAEAVNKAAKKSQRQSR